MHYRVYFLDAANHIIRSHDLECDDDADAIERLRELNHAHAMELWERARLVRRIEPPTQG